LNKLDELRKKRGQFDSSAFFGSITDMSESNVPDQAKNVTKLLPGVPEGAATFDGRLPDSPTKERLVGLDEGEIDHLLSKKLPGHEKQMNTSFDFETMKQRSHGTRSTSPIIPEDTDAWAKQG
jgi:hypothetical protein